MSRTITHTSHRSRTVISRAIRCEMLERRMLMSLAPIGGEIPVNSFFASTQQVPAIASDADGDFVVVWEGNGSGDNGGVFARRYNAAGAPLSGDFRVNTTTDGFQGQTAVAMDADGDFVVVWGGNGAGDNAGVFPQRYNAAGVAQGGEFRVNTFTTSGQALPAVAMDAGGNFVVAWVSIGQDGSGNGVYAQRYNASGTPQGAESRVNTRTTSDQTLPAVTMSADGRFAIAWDNFFPTPDPGGFGQEVYCQRYDASGVPQGGELHVNTFTTGSQSGSAIAMDSIGDFVVSWQSEQDAPDSSFGVYGRRFNAAGVAQGSEFRANTLTAGSQFFPAVAMDADGDFLVAWESYAQDGSSWGIYRQSLNAAGVSQGGELRVNTFTADAQENPTVAMDAAGDAVVAWHSNGQDGSGNGVYAQRFDESTEAAGPVLSGLARGPIPIAAGERLVMSMPSLVLNFSEELSVAGGTGAVNSATNPANYALTRDGVDVSGRITSASFVRNAVVGKYQATLNFSAPLSDGNYVVTARQTLRDLAGNALDGNLDGSPGGGDASIAFSVLQPVNVGPEFRVNTFTTDVQRFLATAADAAGNFVVVWESIGHDGSNSGVYAQRYSAAGQPRGSEFRVNTFTTGSQGLPTVAMEANGDFVVAWRGNGSDDAGIYARRFNAAGVALGAEFFVNTTTAGGGTFPQTAMDADGDFVIAWDGNGVGDDRGIFARRYNNAGAAQGDEFRVNTVTASIQQNATVAMDADGDFVVGWSSSVYDGTGGGGRAQRYNADGLAQGGQFNTTGSNAIAMYAGGEFIVVGAAGLPNDPDGGVFFQRFNAAGQSLGGPFLVNTFTTGIQRFADVAIDQSGDFVVTWVSVGQDGSSDGIYAQRFNASGGAEGPEFRVNTITNGAQIDPSVAMSATGDFVIAWTGNGTGDADGVFAQRYAPNQAPTTLGIPAVNVLQDAPDTVIDLRASFDDSTDPDNLLTFSIVGNTNPTLFTATPVNNAAGTLILDYAPGQTGQATITVRSTDTGGLFVETSFLVTVNPPVTVSGSEFLFATAPHRLRFTFTDNVSGSLSTSDVVLQNLTTSTTIPASDLSISYDSGTNTATFSYTGSGGGIVGVLPDGNYCATLLAAGINNPQGVHLPANHLFNFFFLRGDATHDGRVNLTDFNILASNFGQSPRNFTQADFTYDGLVNLADFNILAGRFGQVLAAGTFGRDPVGATSDGDDQRETLEELT